MKLSKINEAAREYTKLASEIVRQLSLAGIGIIWLFKNSDGSDKLFDPILIVPLLLLAFALFCDLIQYIIGGIIWRSFTKNNQHLKTIQNPDPEIDIPDSKSTPTYLFYAMKIIAMFIAYIFIITHLIKVLFPCSYE
jgi:hypothetical protein